MSPTADVAIVGAGIIGCALALELAETDRSVVVLERGEPGGEASSAAAGMLAPYSEAPGAGPFLDLARASLALFEPLAARLRDLTGADVEYRKSGMLHVALDEAEGAVRRAEAERLRAAGIEARWLDADEARRLEPQLPATAHGAVHLPGDHQVDNALLTRTLSQAAAMRGARFVLARAVTRLVREGSRVTGVEAGGERLAAGVTVLAAGAWSAALAATAGLAVPVGPAKGQMLSAAIAPDRLRLVVASSAVYLVPRAGGRVLVGATVEDAGFDARVTLAAVAHLARAAGDLCPRIAAGTLERAWAGFRPRTPDDLPILGGVPGLDGLLLATGHFRNGILLAPITARLLADLVASGRPSPLLAPFTLARFAA